MFVLAANAATQSQGQKAKAKAVAVSLLFMLVIPQIYNAAMRGLTHVFHTHLKHNECQGQAT